MIFMEEEIDSIHLTAQEIYDWVKQPDMLANINDKGDFIGYKEKPPIFDRMTCRIRILLHCIRHPNDKIGFDALIYSDKEFLTMKWEEESKKKKKRRRRRK